MELVFLLVSAWGLRSGGLSVKPRGLEHPLGCAHWRRPSGCKRQLSRSGSLAWMRRFADVSCLCLRVCERCLQVRDWAKAVLPRSPQVAETLHEQEVDGEDVLDLTYQRLVAEPYTIAAGPAGKLAKRIAALSAPPAASGFQVGASAERDWGRFGVTGEVC